MSNTKPASESSKFKELWDAVVSAHFKLNHPDMGGQNYLDAKREINKAHNLLPAVQAELKRKDEALNKIWSACASDETDKNIVDYCGSKSRAVLNQEQKEEKS